MKKLLEKFNLALEMLFKVLEHYSKIVVFGVVFLICASVFSRKFLHYSIVWSEEVVLLLMVWVAFIATALGVAKNKHIRITLLYDKLPKPAQKVSQWLEYAATIFVGAMMLNYGSILVKFTLRSTLPTTKWPSFLLYLMIPVCGFYMIYCTVLHMFFPKAAKVFEDPEEKEENV